MKRIGFDHIDPTPKPETSFHAPLLPQLVQGWGFFLVSLALMFHESPATTTDSTVLPVVLWCWPLRRTVQVRLGTNTLRLPGGTAVFAVSRQQFMKHQS
jgi:hypothetical protein